MKEIADVLDTSKSSPAERAKAKRTFLTRRQAIWDRIQDGQFPASYVSGGKKYSGAPRRTAVKCDFLLANKKVLGSKYPRDKIADAAQRDLLFHVLRGREVFPNRPGSRFYCCVRCTSKLLECVKAKVFRYIDNDKWRAEIEKG